MFDRVLSAPLECWKLSRITWLYGFSVNIPRCYKDDYVSSLFPPTIRPSNFLLVEYFPLTYDLNCIKSRVNRHLSVFQLFRIPVFLYAFRPCLIVLVTLRPVVAVQPCVVSISFKKKKSGNGVIKSRMFSLFIYSANIYWFKVNNRNLKKVCEICSKSLTVKTPERRQWHRSDLFIDEFEQISHIISVSPLLTLNK